MGNTLVDTFTMSESVKTEPWKICEDAGDKENSVVDGVNILARAEGPFFVVDGESLNKRFYSRSLWDSAIANNSERLEFREMLGTIGHEQELSDNDLLKGLASHIVSKLWIDEEKKVGMGEVLVLNTPAGQALNTYLRSGVRLKVSSRADGDYSGQTDSGAKIVEEKSFKLQGFDFVQSPGIDFAIPKIMESTEEKVDSIIEKLNNTEESFTMDNNELLESLAGEKSRLSEAVTDLTAQVKSHRTANESLEKVLESRNKEVSELQDKLDIMTQKTSESEEEMSTEKEELERYRELGSVEDLAVALEKNKDTDENLNRLGNFDLIENALKKGKTQLDKYNELGTVEEISKVFENTRKYLKVGKLNQLEKMAESHKLYEELGSTEELAKVMNLTKSYVALGTPNEITKVCEALREKISEAKSAARKEKVNMLAESQGITKVAAAKLLSKYTISEAMELTRSLKNDDVSNRYKSDKKITESVDKKAGNSPLTGSRAERLMSSFSK